VLSRLGTVEIDNTESTTMTASYESVDDTSGIVATAITA
jgi:hypothetical protein